MRVVVSEFGKLMSLNETVIQDFERIVKKCRRTICVIRALCYKGISRDEIYWISIFGINWNQ